MTKTKRNITVTVLALLALVVGLAVQAPSNVQAADSDFSNGITVDSTLDTGDDNIGDSDCNDGAGNCTLRAAIEESNAAAGTQTIRFNITGTADFTNQGQNGYTIAPASALPQITDTVIIDGYTQPGAQANTAPAPEPLNGILLIEIDGTNAGASIGVQAVGNGADSQISGLVINSFEDSGIGLETTDVVITGNYIGTSPDGTGDKGNGWAGIDAPSGIGAGAGGAIIGGTNPADRNLISGNGSSGIFPVNDWIIQGNYVGTDVTGSAAIPNSTSNSSGALSIDDCSNVLVGGTQTGAANVISGNTVHGIAPHDCPGTRIEGNLIGTDWTGQTALPNQAGITLSGDQTGTVVGGTSEAARNIISGNTSAGIIDGSTDGVSIEGNYVGLNSGGNEAIPNGTGIMAGNNSIVGGSIEARNVISGNTYSNVLIVGAMTPTSGTSVSGNYIGTNASGDIDADITSVQGEGVRVSGNTSGHIIGGDVGNRIAGNRGSGVAIRSWTITAFSLTATPSTTAVLGNEIYGNAPGGSVPDSEGLGIDLYAATVASVTSPTDILTDSTVNTGPTANDSSDADTGPNGYINFPVLNSAVQTGTSLALNYDLDAADSPSDEYRIEFFANDAADSSSHGEGQTFLGAVTASNGSGNTATLTLPNGVDLTGKVLSATTTAINNTTDSGFGGTSEFSATLAAEIISPNNNAQAESSGQDGALAKTGHNLLIAVGVGALLVSITLAITVAQRRYVYRRWP